MDSRTRAITLNYNDIYVWSYQAGDTSHVFRGFLLKYCKNVLLSKMMQSPEDIFINGILYPGIQWVKKDRFEKELILQFLL